MSIKIQVAGPQCTLIKQEYLETRVRNLPVKSDAQAEQCLTVSVRFLNANTLCLSN